MGLPADAPVRRVATVHAARVPITGGRSVAGLVVTEGRGATYVVVALATSDDRHGLQSMDLPAEVPCVA